MKNVTKPLAKSVLTPLELTAAGSAADVGILRKILGCGNTKPIISKYEMEDIIKIVRFFEYSGLLLKGVSETIQNETKEQKGRFFSRLWRTLGAPLLRNILADKGMNRAREGFVRAGCGSSMKNSDFWYRLIL